MPTPWETAIESKDIEKIQAVLASGYIPKNLRTPIIVESYFAGGEERILPITQILLESDSVDCFKIAGKFVELGAELPLPRKNRSDFLIVSEYLNYLAHDKHDLFIALRTDPNLMSLRDERQATLLHHVAGVGLMYKDNSAQLILSQVLLPTANFQAQDQDRITPLHRVAAYGYEKVTRRTVIPSFITAAIKSKNGFDFETKDFRGHTFLDVVKIVAPQRILNVDEYARSLQLLYMKPFAEVRKNTRVLLGRKKPGKDGTLSVLPLEILIMILEKTNDDFYDIEANKRMKLILEYSKGPIVSSKMATICARIKGFWNDYFVSVLPTRQTLSSQCKECLINSIFFLLMVVHMIRASHEQRPRAQQLQRPSSRFEQVRNTILGIAIFIHFTQAFFANLGGACDLNNDKSKTASLSLEERFHESPFIASMQILSGALGMLACAMMAIEHVQEQATDVQNFLVRTRNSAYAFWNEIGGDTNHPVQQIEPTRTEQRINMD